jgi:hypothetical protein
MARIPSMARFVLFCIRALWKGFDFGDGNQTNDAEETDEQRLARIQQNRTAVRSLFIYVFTVY